MSGPILITGAAGWLGSRLVEACARGLPDYPELKCSGTALRCLVLPRENPRLLASMSPEIQVFEGDLRCPADCDRFVGGAAGGLLFHTAGIIHPRRVSDFYDINVTGTCNLLHAASRAGLRRAVVVSSNSPCGCNPHPDHLFDELSPYRPYMNYGRSKMLMEQAVREFEAVGRMETVLIRCPWFYGPNQPPRQSEFFRMIRQGKVPIVGSGENLRSMSYVDNLCQGLLLAGSDATSGQTYWLADERPYRMNEIIGAVRDAFEEDFQLPCKRGALRLPSLASTVARWLDYVIQSSGMYHQKIHVLSEMNQTIACSVQRAMKDFGYRPTVELREGMRRSIAWCLEKGIPL